MKRDQKQTSAPSTNEGSRGLSIGQVFFIMCLMLFFLSYLSVRPKGVKQTTARDTTSPSSIPAASAMAAENDRRLLRMKQTTLKKQALMEALELVAAQDERGKILIDFHARHAFYSILVGRGVTVHLLEGPAPKNHPLEFEVTIASREEREANGLPTHAAFEWSGVRNELFIAPIEGITREWAGILFAHELSHAYDLVMRIEPPSLRPSDTAYLEGELRAYEMEFRLIQHQTKGTYREAVMALLEKRELLNGGPPFLRTSLFSTDEIDGVDRRFSSPPLGVDEEAARRGMVVIALNLVRIEHQNGGEPEKIAFLRDLYTAIMP